MAHIQSLIDNYACSDDLFILYFLDLDGFKDINDNLGHQAGDEFCILLEGTSNLLMVAEFSERLLDNVSEPMILSGRSIVPRTSIGYTLYPDHADTKESRLQAADIAM